MIIPSYTYIATASAVLSIGAIPVICEIDRSLSLDALDIRDKITDKTKAVIVVHLQGSCGDLRGIQNVCKDYNLPLIEDSSQSFGATYDGKIWER